MDEVDQHLDELRSCLDKLCAQVDAWRQAAAGFSERPDARKVSETGQFKLKSLVLMHEQMEHKLVKLQHEFDESFEKLHESLRNSWSSLREAYKKARELGLEE